MCSVPPQTEKKHNKQCGRTFYFFIKSSEPDDFPSLSMIGFDGFISLTYLEVKLAAGGGK
jgi:hypothetical protein